MLRFYLSLVREIPTIFRSRAEGWTFWIVSVAVPIIVLFNPELKSKMDTPEFSRWFALVPIAMFVLYALLRVNYDRFIAVAAGRDEAKATLTAVKNSQPQLRLREPGAVHVEKDVLFTGTVRTDDGQEKIVPILRADFLKVRFVNDPILPSSTAVAPGVLAKIEYSHEDRVLRILDARWSASTQPGRLIAEHQSIVDLLRMKFGIGDERDIDIAMKDRKDRCAYMYNNDSYHNPKRADFALEPGTYKVRVRLYDVGVDSSPFEFSFRHGGENTTIEIMQ